MGIVAAVPDAWYSYWQTRHYVLAGLSKLHPVMWLEPPRSIKQLLIRMLSLSTNTMSSGDFPDPPVGINRIQPSLRYPKVYRWPRISRKLYIRTATLAARRLRQKGCEWVVGYLWRPEASELVHCSEFDSICYHVDDDYTFSDVVKNQSVKERKILESADLVFIHSDRVAEKLAPYTNQVVRVQNGVDYKRYSMKWPCPDDLVGINSPLVGYSGYLKTQMDWELILDLAQSMPWVSFVFVGPCRNQPEIEGIVERVDRLSNVFFLGGKPANRLPAYVTNFDICLMPYRVTGYTNSINPIKLQEYLAAGKPIISSNLDSIYPYSDVVEICTTVSQWQDAIFRALSQRFNDQLIVERRRAKARANDWSVVCGCIHKAMVGLAGSLHNQPGSVKFKSS